MNDDDSIYPLKSERLTLDLGDKMLGSALGVLFMLGVTELFFPGSGRDPVVLILRIFTFVVLFLAFSYMLAAWRELARMFIPSAPVSVSVTVTLILSLLGTGVIALLVGTDNIDYTNAGRYLTNVVLGSVVLGGATGIVLQLQKRRTRSQELCDAQNPPNHTPS